MAEATSTLADTLLDDLDDLSDVEQENLPTEEDGEEQEQQQQPREDTETTTDHQDTDGDSKRPSRSKSRYLDHPSLQQHLKRMEENTAEKTNSSTTTTNNKNKNNDCQDYELIVASNKFRTILSDELHSVFVQLSGVYSLKFPELLDLLTSPLHYKSAVQVIQNEMDLTRVNEALNDHFNSNQIITMTVASSTTEGRLLTDEELSESLQLAAYMDEIDAVQQRLAKFVEDRVAGLAPATCALLGPHVTALLLGLAGGLHELAHIPACNLQVLGQTRATADSRAGLSSRSTPLAHVGVLRHCDLLSQPNIAPQHRIKLLKQVSGKTALCLRCDSVNVQQGRTRTAVPGEKYRQEILTKLRQWQEPDQAPTQKALPKPDLTVKKRRGGRRMRQLKERFEETALMKQANTRSFSAQAGEYGDDAMGLTLGLLDTVMDEGGNVRKNATGEKRKARISNTQQARKQRALATKVSRQFSGGANNSDGLASTVAFTPLQAMELVNPDAQKERVRQANQKWFADSAGFQSALPKHK